MPVDESFNQETGVREAALHQQQPRGTPSSLLLHLQGPPPFAFSTKGALCLCVVGRLESAGSPPAGDEEPSAGSAGAGETARPRAEVGRGPARYYRHAETNGLQYLGPFLNLLLLL